MWSRRRFMFLIGGATSGLWLASTGLVKLERSFVLSLAGACWFCGKDRTDVRSLVGAVGREPTICDECIGLCCDIIAEEIGEEARHAATPREPRPAPSSAEPLEERVAELLRQLQELAPDHAATLLDHVRLTFKGFRRGSIDVYRCTFCDRERRDVVKLIAGPRAFICDVCVGDATQVVAHVLRG